MNVKAICIAPIISYIPPGVNVKARGGATIGAGGGSRTPPFSNVSVFTVLIPPTFKLMAPPLLKGTFATGEMYNYIFSDILFQLPMIVGLYISVP